jgi:hypothetical protein
MVTAARERQDFVDALRDVLRLAPLYRVGRVELEPCYQRRAFADMLSASGDGNRHVRTPTSERGAYRQPRGERLELEAHRATPRTGDMRRAPTRLNGQRVGSAFTRAKHGKAS